MCRTMYFQTLVDSSAMFESQFDHMCLSHLHTLMQPVSG